MVGPVILFAPVSSSRTAPALLSRLPLSRAAVPFGQWNVCNNALWASPGFGQPGRLWIEAKLLEFPRSAAIAGPFEAVSRCGQPGVAGLTRRTPLDHLRHAFESHVPFGTSLRCFAWWRRPCTGRRSRRLTCLGKARFWGWARTLQTSRTHGKQVRRRAAREMLRGSAEAQPRRCGTRLSSPSHSVGARSTFRDGVSAPAAGGDMPRFRLRQTGMWRSVAATRRRTARNRPDRATWKPSPRPSAPGRAPV